MNFTFEITSIEEAEDCLALPPEFHPDHLISIGAPWKRELIGIKAYKGNLLRLVFCDVKHPLEGATVWERPNISVPTEGHVQEIIDFGRNLETGHLLVHCEMGISRSSAAALIVLATHSDPSQAGALEASIYANRTIACPNNWMLSMADELLGWGGRLAAMGGWELPDRKFSYQVPLPGR